MNRKSSSNNNSTPGGGVLRISSDGDNRRSFLSLEFSTPGCFLVRNIWQVFFFFFGGGGVVASLISPSKMILFEKKYQIFLPPFHHPRFICNLEYPFPPLGTVRNYIGPLFVFFFFDTCTLIPFQKLSLSKAPCSQLSLSHCFKPSTQSHRKRLSGYPHTFCFNR